MIEYLLVGIALFGSSTASYFDVRTTEIPDRIPLIMGVLGVSINGILSILTSNAEFFIYSLLAGGGLFFLGWAMYLSGQWGGGDAKILASIGFLLPKVPLKTLFPFPITYLFNLFLVGAIYIIIYALVISFLNKKVSKTSLRELKDLFQKLSPVILLISVILFLVIKNLTITLGILGISISFLACWKWLRVVEYIGFRKIIYSEKLREGDILGEDIEELGLKARKIRGLRKNEVEKIKELKEKVVIREGVRFCPSFPIALLLSLSKGNLLIYLLPFI